MASLAVERTDTLRRAVRAAVPAVIATSLLLVLYRGAPAFFHANNLINILVQTSSLAIMAIGLTFVMLTGGIDLSIPAVMAFSAVLGAFVMPVGGIAAGVAVMLLTGAAIGLFNGLAVAYLGMTPFVVTLATMTVVGGATVWLTDSQSLSDFPDAFFELFLARVGGVPLSIGLAVVILVGATLLTSSTAFGRALYAIGLSQRSAAVARVAVRRVTCLGYATSGALAGLTAVLLTARLGSASANLGNDGVVLDIVSACVVGGVSIYGGSGRPIGAVLGALFITLVSNSLNQLGVSYFINLVVKGCAIVTFISLDQFLRGLAR